jgi:hypothetical protein
MDRRSDQVGAINMNTPRYVTFTGADDATDIAELQALAEDYSDQIEFGILWSAARAGQPRYPTQERFRALAASGLPLAAHICGDDARVIAEHGDNQELSVKGFERVQLNVAGNILTRYTTPTKLAEWGDRHGVRVILQCRDAFPEDSHVDWLFDTSGGRGITPAAWPRPPNRGFVGYAGGLGPGAAWGEIAKMTWSRFYWLDMETKLRNSEDKFDVSICRQVMEEIYG